MDNCELDYRSCGHCKVRFDGPYGHEARPSCDKSSFFEMLFGGDWCPNAPMTEDDDMKIYNKYKIEHTDGTPLKGKKYFVLRLDSDDPIESDRVNRAMSAYEKKPRNCDVGTVDEQTERFIDYCCSKCDGSSCKHGLNLEDEIYKCALKWAQMPYTEEGIEN